LKFKENACGECGGCLRSVDRDSADECIKAQHHRYRPRIIQLYLIAIAAILVFGCSASSRYARPKFVDLRGIVVDQNNLPVKSAKIRIFNKLDSRKTISNENGRFKISNVSARNSYEFNVDAVGFLTLSLKRINLESKPGFEYCLRLNKEKYIPDTCNGLGIISGLIVDEKGKPVPGASVRIEGTSVGAVSGFDGSFVILDAPLGTYALSATAVGYTKAQYEGVLVLPDFRINLIFTLQYNTLVMDINLGHGPPQFNKRDSSNKWRKKGEDIKKMPAENVEDVLKACPGLGR